MCLQAGAGVHLSAVQFELDGIIHGLLANSDRKFVYGEMVSAYHTSVQMNLTCLMLRLNKDIPV